MKILLVSDPNTKEVRLLPKHLLPPESVDKVAEKDYFDTTKPKDMAKLASDIGHIFNDAPKHN